MPPVPIFTDRPINAAQAAENQAHPTNNTNRSTNNHDAPAFVPASTTASPPSSTNSARPGIPAVPASTSSATHMQSSQYPPPTRTTVTAGNTAAGPPPPQPGAAPVPPNNFNKSAGATGPHPPQPPQPGHTPRTVPPLTSAQQSPPSTTAPSAQPPPNQFRMAPPTLNQAPVHSTSTSTGPRGTTVNFGPMNGQTSPPEASLQHPPGYVQNPHASEMMPTQREAQERSETGAGRSGSIAGILGGTMEGAAGGTGEEGEGMWETTKKWAAIAGSKATELEAEVWKKVNGEK